MWSSGILLEKMQIKEHMHTIDYSFLDDGIMRHF